MTFFSTDKKVLIIHIFDGNCYDAEAYLDDLKVSNINEENSNSRGIFFII
jgi:hypothetical protein